MVAAEPENEHVLDRRHDAKPVLPLYVDVSPLRERRLTGIARFAARLICALAKSRPLMLFIPGIKDEIPLDKSNLPDPGKGLDEWARQLWKLPHQRHQQAIARQTTALFPALRPGTRYFKHEIGIFHDFTPLLLPWCHSEATRQSFGAFFAVTAALCDRMITNSQSTHQDASWLSTATKVIPGYPGPSLCVEHHVSSRIRKRRSNVALIVGTLEPRKNGLFVLDWFKNSPALPADMELWWAGPRGWWATKEHLRDLSHLKATGKRRVRFLGMVSDHRLCELYQEATFTLYPSLYEGFGFPVLDSLLHGAPVLCSYNSSLKEFDSPGVFYFDPCDRSSLDEAWNQWRDAREIVIDREALRRRFSWDRLAQSVWDQVLELEAASLKAAGGVICA